MRLMQTYLQMNHSWTLQQISENVVSLARNIGYVPRSKTAATASIQISDINLGTTNSSTPRFLTLRTGLYVLVVLRIQLIVFQYLMKLHHLVSVVLVELHSHNF